MAAKLSLIDEGVLYANPHPADWPIHAYYARFVELDGGEILCAYKRASALYGDDGKTFLLRTKDGCRTWDDEGCLYDGRDDDKPYAYSVTSLTRLRGGDLILSGVRVNRPTPDTPMCNDETGGVLEHEGVFFRSADGGKTWAGPTRMNAPLEPFLLPYDSVTELADGRWFVTADLMKRYDDPAPIHAYVGGLFSDNEGRDWGDAIPLAGGPKGDNTFWHTRVIQLFDGRLIGFPWTGDASGQKFLTLHRVIGDPDGRTWSAPEPTGLLAQTNRPVDLGNGRLAIVMSVRESEHPGIYMALSEDFGATWDIDGQVQIWDAYGQDSIGAPRTESYPSSHDTIAFGAPDAIRLSDGDILAGFWAGQRGQMVCRWSRLRVQ